MSRRPSSSITSSVVTTTSPANPIAEAQRRKRQRTDEENGEEEEVHEVGQGAFATPNPLCLYNVMPAYIDIPITLVACRTAGETYEIKLDFRKCYYFNTEALPYFKARKNYAVGPPTIFDNLLSLIGSENMMVHFTHCSTKLKFIQSYSIENVQISSAIQKQSKPCSQPIVIAYPKTPRQCQHADIMEESLDWTKLNVLRQNSIMKTHQIGDVVTLHDHHYSDEHWIELPDKENQRVSDTVGAFFTKFKLNNKPYQYTVPINTKYTENSQHNLHNITAKKMSDDIKWHQPLSDPLVNTYTTHIQESTNDHARPYVFVYPMNNGMGEIQEGYLTYDLVRSVSFVVRLWNTHGASPNIAQKIRVPNFQAVATTEDTYNNFITACKNRWPRQNQTHHGYVTTIH